MAVFSTANLFGMTIRESANDGSDFTNPDADYRRLFLGEDGLLHVKDSAGTVTSPYAAATAPFVGARAVANAVTAVADQTWTSVAFAGTDRYDSDAFHNPASNNSRLTVPSGKGGYYQITATVGFAANATGLRGIRLFLNGATRIGGETLQNNNGAAQGWRATASTIYALVATDYVEVQVWQNSTGSLNTENIANGSGEFMLALLGT